MTPIDLDQERKRRREHDEQLHQQDDKECQEAKEALLAALNKAWDQFDSKNEPKNADDIAADAEAVMYVLTGVLIELAERRGRMTRGLAAGLIGQALFDVGRADGYDEALDEINYKPTED
jgi:hypothetical protein